MFEPAIAGVSAFNHVTLSPTSWAPVVSFLFQSWGLRPGFLLPPAARVRFVTYPVKFKLAAYNIDWHLDRRLVVRGVLGGNCDCVAAGCEAGGDAQFAEICLLLW